MTITVLDGIIYIAVCIGKSIFYPLHIFSWHLIGCIEQIFQIIHLCDNLPVICVAGVYIQTSEILSVQDRRDVRDITECHLKVIQVFQFADSRNIVHIPA